MIIAITDRFPYDGEPFLKIEDKFLDGEIVYFALQAKDVPKDNDITRDSYSLCVGDMTLGIFFLGILGVFNKIFIEELILMKRRRALSLNNVRKAIGMYGRAKKAEKMIRSIMKNQYSVDIFSDDVVVYSYWMAVHALTGALLARKSKGIRFITRAHSYDLYEFRSMTGYIPFRKAIIDSANLVCPISSNGRDYILSHYGEALDKKIIIQRLGTEDHGLNPRKQTEEFVIVSCANIVSEKRIELIVSALSMLEYGVNWVHFGEGDKGEEIRSLASELLDCKTNINYSFRGRVSNKEIIDYYCKNHIDLFINTSEIEGIPVSIMEAISFGIPVIATNVGGTKEIIEHNVNGRLVDSDAEIGMITEEIVSFINMDGTEVEAFRLNAREKWKELYNAENNYCEFEQLLK